jgi:hypothetical protein
MTASAKRRLKSVSAPPSVEAAEPPSGFTALTLRRTGGLPHVCAGRLTADITGWRSEQREWFDVAVYREPTGGWIGHIRLFRKSADEEDWSWVICAPSFPKFAARIEAFDPACAVPIAADIIASPEATAVIALKAISAKLRTQALRATFQQIAGDLLTALSQAQSEAT